MKIYVLTKRTFNRLKGRYGVPHCNGCGKEFEQGERVVSQIKTTGTVQYHTECYESLFIEV